jgi:glycosyltransferase involved in cell wall biosynthesis
MVRRAGLSERVHRLGYRPPATVSDWMAVADLCVLPLPPGATDARSSLLVALAHSKATVVVGRGVFSKYMRDGEHLCWTPEGDPRRLADLLDGLIREPERRDRLGRAARELCGRHYTWPQIADATVAIYRELVPEEGAQTVGHSGVQAFGVGPSGS